VLREAAISDDGPVFTRELDQDLWQHDAAAAEVTRVLRPAWAEVLFGWGPGYVPLSGDASLAAVSRVAS
jgi:hypothetical protein